MRMSSCRRPRRAARRQRSCVRGPPPYPASICSRCRTRCEPSGSWPGLAGSLVTAARELDFPLLAALTIGTTWLVLAGSLLADLAHAFLDPRVADDA